MVNGRASGRETGGTPTSLNELGSERLVGGGMSAQSKGSTHSTRLFPGGGDLSKVHTGATCPTIYSRAGCLRTATTNQF